MSSDPNLADPAWAWAAYRPDGARPWTLAQAGHLYRRAGFGATWDQLQQALRDGPQATVDKLVTPGPSLASFNRGYEPYERAAATGAAAGATAWWLRRMMESPGPLQEQLTLFWHNYFAISNERVNNPALMCRYLAVLRAHGLGRFDAMLPALLNEPAVFMCLEARANRRARPTDHFARVLLEQFTVGPGQFTEADVHAAARAFTGWFVSQEQLRFQPREHDPGTITLLGQAGPLDSPGAVRLLLAHPATSRQVARKLYRWFISENGAPSDALLAPLAAGFARDYNTGRVVEVMLRSNLFFSAAAYRQKIRSPVEFALGVAVPLGGTIPTLRLAGDLSDLGQDLFRPPTRKGWAGGRCWLNRVSLAGRVRLAESLLNGSGAYEGKLDPGAVATRHHCDTPDGQAKFLGDLLLPGDSAIRPRPGAGARTADDPRRMAAALAGSPEFQLS
jgi:uncharacterized protein (DUF1800 family)